VTNGDAGMPTWVRSSTITLTTDELELPVNRVGNLKLGIVVMLGTLVYPQPAHFTVVSLAWASSGAVVIATPTQSGSELDGDQCGLCGHRTSIREEDSPSTIYKTAGIPTGQVLDVQALRSSVRLPCLRRYHHCLLSRP